MNVWRFSRERWALVEKDGAPNLVSPGKESISEGECLCGAQEGRQLSRPAPVERHGEAAVHACCSGIVLHPVSGTC